MHPPLLLFSVLFLSSNSVLAGGPTCDSLLCSKECSQKSCSSAKCLFGRCYCVSCLVELQATPEENAVESDEKGDKKVTYARSNTVENCDVVSCGEDCGTKGCVRSLCFSDHCQCLNCMKEVCSDDSCNRNCVHKKCGAGTCLFGVCDCLNCD